MALIEPRARDHLTFVYEAGTVRVSAPSMDHEVRICPGDVLTITSVATDPPEVARYVYDRERGLLEAETEADLVAWLAEQAAQLQADCERLAAIELAEAHAEAARILALPVDEQHAAIVTLLLPVV